MASNISKKEKQLTVKRISETLKNIDKWMIVCEEGKPIIQEILAAKKDLTKEKDFSHQLQNLCDKLNDSMPKLEAILISIDESHEKLQSVHELSNLSFNASSSNQSSFSLEGSFAQDTIAQVLFHHQTISDHLKSQFQLLKDVAENIGTVSSIQQSVFLACSWTMQPYLSDDYFVAVEFLKTQN
jgi:hypothetical protein